MTIEQKAAEWVQNRKILNQDRFPPVKWNDVSDAFLAGAQSGWVKVEDGLPEPDVRVLAMVEGDPAPKVMVRVWQAFEDDLSGYVWCNCYGDIYGDAEFDDDYKVLEWHSVIDAPYPMNAVSQITRDIADARIEANNKVLNDVKNVLK